MVDSPLLTPPQAAALLGRHRASTGTAIRAAYRLGDPAVVVTPTGYAATEEWWRATFTGRKAGRPPTRKPPAD